MKIKQGGFTHLLKDLHRCVSYFVQNRAAGVVVDGLARGEDWGGGQRGGGVSEGQSLLY